jgi:formate dehydrogenase major subunit
VLEPLGESRPDWEIIQDIANRLGAGWKYEHPSQIYEEIAPLTPLMAGVTYERWKATSRCNGRWPKTAAISRCFIPKQFKFPDGKAKFLPLEWTEPTDQQDANTICI